MKPSFAALLLLSAATWTGCEKEAPEAPKVQEVILNVRTLDTAQKPVEMVRFYINGKKFGITDQDGTFQGRHAAKDGDTLSFNVEPPDGYSVPADIDQSQWQYTVKYPADGRPLQLDFTANLQRPERDYLFMVRTPAPGTTVSVNGNVVGKTGATGDAMLRVSGTPGLAFNAEAGDIKLAATFAEDDEVYLLTTDKAGPVNPPAVAAAEPPPEADPPAAPPGTPASEAVAEAEPPAAPPSEAPEIVAKNDPPPVREPEQELPPVAAPPPRIEPAPVAARVEPAPVAARVEPAPRAEPTPRVPVAAPAARRETPQPRVREPVERPVARPSRPARVEEDPTDIIDDSPPVDTGRSAIVAREPEPPPVERTRPAPAAKDSELAELGLFDDDPKGSAGLDTPPPVPVPVPAADPVKLGGTSAALTASNGKANSGKVQAGDLIDDDTVVDKGAINSKVAVTGGTAPSAGSMDRAEISEKLERIKGTLAQTTVLQKADVDFLSSVDRTHPGYYEANRLLADYYFRLKDYRREAESLDAATTGGRYKHDPMVLLSLAKAYAHTKDYRRALSTMKRVEAKMRNLPAEHKADAYRVHAEMLEFEFLRQFHEDAKRANVSLVDKAIGKWENLQTFSAGADANAAALASKKIRELNELKSRVEL